MEHQEKPKIGLYDLEISPTWGTFWGSRYETNILEITHPWVILSFSWKWLDGEHITKGLPDYPGYKKGSLDDSKIVRDLHKLVDQCDVLVGQNSDQFDVKKMNSRFVIHNLQPPSPYRTVDTLKIARQKFGFTSNKLDDLGEALGLGRKLEHEGYNMWRKCIAGDPAAWKKMLAYNKIDVLLLESVYRRLRPWTTNHPNVAAYIPTTCCTVCGSKELRSKGWRINQSGGRYRKIQCQSCGKWSHSPVNEKTNNPLRP